MDRAPDILELISAMKQKGEAFALATVVRTVAATAAKARAKAVIRAEAPSRGWTGRGCARRSAQAAREAIADDRPASFGAAMTCCRSGLSAGDEQGGIRFVKNMCPSQGTMDVFVEPVLPRRRSSCGSSPIAVAIADPAGGSASP